MPKYVHLTIGERRIIARMHGLHYSYQEIASALNRSKSTICRELRRNAHHNADRVYYTYTKAQEKAQARLTQSRKHTHFNQHTWEMVVVLLKKKWSPEQISHVLHKEHDIPISHEAIYQYIYRDRKNGGSLIVHLRHRTRKRRKRYRSRDNRGRLAGKTMIDERPEHVMQRNQFGHWEIDTVLGKSTKHCLVTIVERMTGYTLIGFMKNRTTTELNKVAINLMKSSRFVFHTITADNGTEFHGYKEIERALNTKVYFAHPHHAWERGTNENTNGLIRQYYPKFMSLKHISQSDCERVCNELNHRPRKRLNYLAPIVVAKRVA